MDVLNRVHLNSRHESFKNKNEAGKGSKHVLVTTLRGGREPAHKSRLEIMGRSRTESFRQEQLFLRETLETYGVSKDEFYRVLNQVASVLPPKNGQQQVSRQSPMYQTLDGLVVEYTACSCYSGESELALDEKRCSFPNPFNDREYSNYEFHVTDPETKVSVSVSKLNLEPTFTRLGFLQTRGNAPYHTDPHAVIRLFDLATRNRESLEHEHLDSLVSCAERRLGNTAIEPSKNAPPFKDPDKVGDAYGVSSLLSQAYALGKAGLENGSLKPKLWQNLETRIHKAAAVSLEVIENCRLVNERSQAENFYSELQAAHLFAKDEKEILSTWEELLEKVITDFQRVPSSERIRFTLDSMDVTNKIVGFIRSAETYQEALSDECMAEIKTAFSSRYGKLPSLFGGSFWQNWNKRLQQVGKGSSKAELPELQVNLREVVRLAPPVTNIPAVIPSGLRC